MIRFKRSSTNVIIEIEHGVFGNADYFTLEINQTRDYQAELLRQAFRENLNRHLIAIKEKYYAEGWKGAKAKTKKRSDFWGGWELKKL